MGTCRYCNETEVVISDMLGYCGDCIRGHFEAVWPEISKVHGRSRRQYGLPEQPPRTKDGTPCPLCFQECRIEEGGIGYCGLRTVKHGRISGGRPIEGNLSCYLDPLPTNCVGGFVCPGGTGCGYPQFAHANGPEYGYKNLAVFYRACAFNCLYCQNYHFKEYTADLEPFPAVNLAEVVDDKTACICYFGGDPTPQILHAVKTARIALKSIDRGILRICWETNGAMKETYLSEMAGLSMQTGGSVKFDLKAWNESIHLALCGVTNRQTLTNFETLAATARQRLAPPFLIASTLLVPGYVDEVEVSAIAKFIARLNPDIPYSLLGFTPHFYLKDLPRTSRDHAQRCRKAAERAGVNQVHIGNVHFLGNRY